MTTLNTAERCFEAITKHRLNLIWWPAGGVEVLDENLRGCYAPTLPEAIDKLFGGQYDPDKERPEPPKDK